MMFPTVFPTAPSAEIDMSGQGSLDRQGDICSLTTVNDTTNGVSDSVTDSVHHAASSIGDTANKTSLSKDQYAFEGPMPIPSFATTQW